jgi:hypothetical protein
MTRLARLVALPALLCTPACLQHFPEASLRSDGSLAADIELVERAVGLRFQFEPTRENLSADEFDQRVAGTMLDASPADHAEFDAAVYAMLRAPDLPRAPSSAGRPRGTRVPRIAYDLASARLLIGSADGAEGEDARTARRRDLARVDALCRALIAQQIEVPKVGAKSRRSVDRDAMEARLSLIAGGAHAGTLDASLAPISAFDASAQQIRRRHHAVTERLLEDPEGAPVRELTRPDIKDAERLALESLLEVEGLERRRRILRVFGGARIALIARERLTTGNFDAVMDDPPQSTEQILDPERYFDYEDPPLIVKAERRDGMLGVAFAVDRSAPAGSFGIFNALEGALPPDVARAASRGWGGDLLTVYDHRETGAKAYAWRFECDSRFAASRLAKALAKAVAIRHGGEFVELEDDVFELQGGSQPCRMLRNDSSLAFVLGGREDLQRVALDELLAERIVPPADPRTRAGGHDFAYRLVRAVASPFFYDAPGRFDSYGYSLYGAFFRHRSAEAVGEIEVLNWSGIPLLSRLLPLDLHGLAFTRERGAYRRDFSIFQQALRWFHDDVRDRHRFWSPFVSWTHTPEYRAFGVFMGFLFEKGEGAGREEFSPRIAWSHATELDGAKRRYGGLIDAVSFARRDGSGTRTELLPYGALAAFDTHLDPNGFSLGFLLDAMLLRRVKSAEGHASFDLAFGWQRLARFHSDAGSGAREISFARGLLFAHHGEPRRHSTGFLRIFGRHFFGFGAEDDRSFVDFIFIRFGG